MAASDRNPFDDLYAPEIMILGIGSILYSDDGFGIRVTERIERGIRVPGPRPGGGRRGAGHQSAGRDLQAQAPHRGGHHAQPRRPGHLYRLEGDAIPERIRAKNSLHQVDFLEALTLCQALDHVPQTVIIGVEPEDIETFSLVMTPTVQAQIEPVIQMVLAELDRLGVSYRKKDNADVPRDPFQDH